VFNIGRRGVSMPTSYADLQDHTEAQSQTTWERESQTSISGSRTLHFASSRVRPVDPSTFGKACTQMFGRKQRLVPKDGTSGDRPPTTYRRLRHGRSALMQCARLRHERGLSTVGVGSAFLPGA